MRTKLRGTRVIIVVSCEKEEPLGNLSQILFKHKIGLRSPERDDRSMIVEYCLSKIVKDYRKFRDDLKCTELAKLLQGKSFRDI